MSTETKNKKSSILEYLGEISLKKQFSSFIHNLKFNVYSELKIKNHFLEKELEKLKEIYINEKKIIAFDMDDTIADFEIAFLEELNRIKGTNYTRKDITSWDLDSLFGENTFNTIVKEGFFINLKPKMNMINAIKMLIASEEYDIYILTACEPSEFLQKIEWVKKYIPEFDYKKIIPLTNKYNFNADLIIDDAEHNIVKCRRKKLLVDMNRNKNVKGVNRIYYNDTPESIVFKIKQELF